MNKVFSAADFDILAALLDPFLKTLGFLSNGELKERILENVFTPLFKNNRTEKVESDDEDEAKKEELF